MTEPGFCPACGASRDAAARFCAQCGAAYANAPLAQAQKGTAEPWSPGSNALIATAGLLIVAIGAVVYFGFLAQSPVATTTSTASPSASGRPSASSRPTASMTTSAQAAPSQEGSAGWVAYYEHVIVADGQLVAALEGINAAARAGDDAAESRALDDLDSIVDTELTWLHNHEPDACYEDLYQQELDVMAQLQVATAANRQWLVTDDAEDLQALVDAFGGATEGIRAIMSSAQAGETCTPVHEGQAQIGEKVSAGDHFLTVKKVEQWQGSGFLTPGPGNVFITVQIEIEAIRNGPPFVLGSMLVTTTGDGYRRELLGRDPDVVSLPEMRSGDVKSAWFTFEIPRDQRGGLVLDYRVGLTGPSIEIALD